jgi:hypothetical protein
MLHTGLGGRPEGLIRYRWWLAEVQPIRRRAGVFLSWAPKSVRPKADLSVKSIDADLEQAGTAIVDALTKKVF